MDNSVITYIQGSKWSTPLFEISLLEVDYGAVLAR